MEQPERQEGFEEGIEKGLEALVSTLKPLLSDFEAVYKAVTANKDYANITEKELRKYY